MAIQREIDEVKQEISRNDREIDAVRVKIPVVSDE
jgi:hypothetical protein